MSCVLMNLSSQVSCGQHKRNISSQILNAGINSLSFQNLLRTPPLGIPITQRQDLGCLSCASAQPVQGAPGPAILSDFLGWLPLSLVTLASEIPLTCSSVCFFQFMPYNRLDENSSLIKKQRGSSSPRRKRSLLLSSSLAGMLVLQRPQLLRSKVGQTSDPSCLLCSGHFCSCCFFFFF